MKLDAWRFGSIILLELVDRFGENRFELKPVNQHYYFLIPYGQIALIVCQNYAF